MADLQATIEIAVELSSFHNVDLFQRGFYHIRCLLKPPEKAATNVDVEYRRNSGEQSDDESLFPALVTPSGMTAVSRTFQILYRNEEIDINDAFIFRLYMLVDSNKITEQIDSADVQLVLELFFSDAEAGPDSPECLVSVSSQILKLHLSCIKGIHHHVPVLFDYFHFAVVDLTIHAAVTGLSLPDPSIIKPVKTSWFGLKSTTSPRLSTPSFYTKLFGNKPLNDFQNSRTPAEQRQIRYAYDTHRSLCSTLLSAEVNLLAYFQCLAEYLPPTERLEIGTVDFGERVDGLINGIEAAKSANEVFAQICSDLNSISLEMSLVWSQFLESYTLNKRVLPYFREEHHRQRIGHFSEAFFIQEFTWGELQIQDDQSFQLHQSLSQRVRSSRYYQSIPALVVECPMLDGDTTSNPIIFEDKYCIATDHSDTAFCEESLDTVDYTCRDRNEDGSHGDGSQGDGNEATGGADDFLNDEELLIIENDYDSPISFTNEGLVLRDPASLRSATIGRPPIRETMILNDSSDDEFIDNGFYKPSADRPAAPDDIRVTFALEEKNNALENKSLTTSNSQPGIFSALNGEIPKGDIPDKSSAVASGLPVSKSKNCAVSNIMDKVVENPGNGDVCEMNVGMVTNKLINDSTEDQTNVTEEGGVRRSNVTEEGGESRSISETNTELADSPPVEENPVMESKSDDKDLEPMYLFSSEHLAVNKNDSKESEEGEVNGIDFESKEIALDEIRFEESEGQGMVTNDEGEESVSSSQETFVLANEELSVNGKSESLEETTNVKEKTSEDHENKENVGAAEISLKNMQEEAAVGDKTQNAATSGLETLGISDGKENVAGEGVGAGDDHSLHDSDDHQDTCLGNDNSVQLNGVSKEVDTDKSVTTSESVTDNNKSVTGSERVTDNQSVTTSDCVNDDNHQSETTSDFVTDDNKSVTSDGKKVTDILEPWDSSLLSYDEQRVHHNPEPLVKTIANNKSKNTSSSLDLYKDNNVTQRVIDQQPRSLRDSVVTDSPSDNSSVYETPMSSEAATSESQAESSSTSDSTAATKTNSAAEKTGTDGKRKKKVQIKSLSTLGSCLPVNCAGNTSPSFKLTRGGSVYGGSVKSRFELAKRFVKRQLHYSCRIYSDLRIERVREPYFTGQRPETIETHLVVCVHGLDGNSGDLRLFRCYLEMSLPSTRFDFLMSEVNQPDTFVTFEEMTEKLVQEIRHYVDAYSIFPTKLSFIGHSLGNLIIRSALTHPDMRPFVDKLHTLLSLSGPHLGMLYPTSPLVSTGLWLMQKWKKSDALLQLSLHDHTDLRQTFLYKLSQSKGLAYFKNILLVSSVQDHYVPYHSARMEMCRAAARDTSEYGTVYREMVDNLMTPLKNKTSTTLIRYSVYHGLPSSANSFIGRAAHIAMLDSELFIEKLLLVSALDYFR